MPTQYGRRKILTDASITVLARDGAHGLTHRTVDATAQVPVGTTSRYFRTRAALLHGVAEAILDLHKEHVHKLAEVLPRSHAGLIEALEQLITDAGGASRELYAARFELGLEATRDERVQAVMNDMRSASLELTRRLLASAGIESSEGQTDTMASFLTGVLFDRISLDRPRIDSRTIAHLLVHGLQAEPHRFDPLAQR